ncbi:hypothetical protein CTAYLR_010538 [Chrysophaeum taylorii]|uniref:Uncharacterized protein n=1 Tax=Chrysophaeum taylorii TaxID=2483200 RepID=A0AAD7UJ48_9STRA|nr:hypothetical protein CTAYLR_010538 [Chrysophaeum taylorii]
MFHLIIGVAALSAPRLHTGGRGYDHITATLEEGDLILYRDGSWLVDEVPVGDDEPTLRFASVNLVQLVWTHNCEHGWVYGMSADVDDHFRVSVDESNEVQVGPEQVVARLFTSDDELDDESRRLVDAARAALLVE